MKREVVVQTKSWSRKDQRWLTGAITVRLCDVEGCNDQGAKWHFPGQRCYCGAHKHLAENQED